MNTVSEADDLPKTEVQVMWVAPPTGSGCVTLTAMVYEGPGRWFADDGRLFRVMCEQKPDSLEIQKECCACNEAKYNVSLIFQLKVCTKNLSSSLFSKEFGQMKPTRKTFHSLSG